LVTTTSATGTAGAARQAPAAALFGPRTDIERRWSAALRHSARVRLLRWGIPASVAAVIAVAVLVSWFNPLRMLRIPTGIGDLVVSGTKITMEHPRLSGFTRDQRAYEVSARSAGQDLTNRDKIELHDIRAKVEMHDRSTVQLAATSGLYDIKAELLTLAQGIELTSSAGYAARLREVVVDIRRGHLLSEHPVAVKFLNGTLDANRLEIQDGPVVRFDGGVAMTLTLPNADAAAPQGPR
jgi:lipopolysaccharide export system protein LptC